MSTTSPATGESSPKAQRSPAAPRILSCAACQQRKVKCDRGYPCARCVKQNVRCVPGTQAVRRRLRRPQQELLDRVQKYEQLLRQHNVEFESIQKVLNSPEEELSDGPDESDDGESRRGAVGEPASSPSVQPKSPFDTINLWRAITQEAQKPTRARDSQVADDLRDRVRNAYEQLGDDEQILIGYRDTVVDLSTCHPSPAHIFRLWQVYLDNVNPLLKITHTPTLQIRIIEAATNVENISPAFEALLFSIYTIAVASLEDDECQAMLQLPKEDLLKQYRLACQQALINAKYLRFMDRDILSALYLYLLSVRVEINHPAVLSTMLGVAVRISQRMGIHRESMLTKDHSPFEAEMRRRLWWSLMLCDARVSERSDHKDSSLAPTWDCKVPTNIDDFYLRPEMETLPVSQETPTEALFVVVWAELSDFIRNTSAYLEFTNPALKPLAKPLPDGGSVASFEKRIEEKYLKHCDLTIPIHYMTAWVARGYLSKCQLWEHYVKFSDTTQSEAQRDNALLLAFRVLECDTKLVSSPLIKRFRWYLQSYFPFPAYIHVVQELRQRPLCMLANRAWKVISDNFEARTPAQQRRFRPIFRMFTRFVLQAWDALRDISDPSNLPETPRIVLSIEKREAEMAGWERDSEAGKQQTDFVNLDAVNAFMFMPMDPSNVGSMFNMANEMDLSGMDSFIHAGMPEHTPWSFDSGQSRWPPTS